MSDAFEERVRSSGYTPKVRELAALFTLLTSGDDELATHAERGLARVADRSAPAAMARFDTAEPPLRGRLCALVGRIASERPEPVLIDWLLVRISDGDPKTRRRAARALGKIGGEQAEAALVAAYRDDVSPPDARAFALALGNAGGLRALARLRRVHTEDPELARIVREACLKLERTELRRAPAAIDATRAPPHAVPVLLHVRAGLEEILLEELGPTAHARIAGRGRIELRLDEPLERLFRARTFLHLGFPLEPVATDGDAAAAVVRALTSPEARDLFRAFTTGKARYRLGWASGGRHRSATFRVAERVAAAYPELVNDPTAAPWEVVVTERDGKEGGRIYVELWPRALDDPRFAYRRRSLPASSHPTIAAALARVGGVVPADVVWDPFTGTGTELVERARLGPYSRLYGTDTDPRALEAASDNLRAASVERTELTLADACTHRLPERPSLVVTNPPFGKRVPVGDVAQLLDAVVRNVANQLAPGGRFVWISPVPARTLDAARRHGLSLRLRREVDVGGFRGELQAFTVVERERRGRA